MSSRADPVPHRDGPMLSRSSAMSQLPRHQALWLVGHVVGAGASWFAGLWTTAPEIALTLSIACGAVFANPFRLWTAPLVAGGVTATGLAFTALEWPAVIGASAAAGALAAYVLPWRTDWLDSVNAALGALTGSSLGLFLGMAAIPASLPAGLAPVLTAAVVGLLGSAGLIPVALRFDQHPTLPSRRDVERALKVGYRPPVFRALDLFGAARKATTDGDTRRGLAEVATWVFKLQITLQALDGELDGIEPAAIGERIARALDDSAADTFTRERKQATAEHLKRLLEHREAIAVERGRTDALVEYALAFLEEARAGLAVARELPGEAIPDRLPEVLGRLRTQARDGDARRRTVRELDRLDQPPPLVVPTADPARAPRERQPEDT